MVINENIKEMFKRGIALTTATFLLAALSSCKKSDDNCELTEPTGIVVSRTTEEAVKEETTTKEEINKIFKVKDSVANKFNSKIASEYYGLYNLIEPCELDDDYNKLIDDFIELLKHDYYDLSNIDNDNFRKYIIMPFVKHIENKLNKKITAEDLYESSDLRKYEGNTSCRISFCMWDNLTTRNIRWIVIEVSNDIVEISESIEDMFSGQDNLKPYHDYEFTSSINNDSIIKSISLNGNTTVYAEMLPYNNRLGLIFDKENYNFKFKTENINTEELLKFINLAKDEFFNNNLTEDEFINNNFSYLKQIFNTNFEETVGYDEEYVRYNKLIDELFNSFNINEGYDLTKFDNKYLRDYTLIPTIKELENKYNKQFSLQELLDLCKIEKIEDSYSLCINRIDYVIFDNYDTMSENCFEYNSSYIRCDYDKNTMPSFAFYSGPTILITASENIARIQFNKDDFFEVIDSNEMDKEKLDTLYKTIREGFNEPKDLLQIVKENINLFESIFGEEINSIIESDKVKKLS